MWFTTCCSKSSWVCTGEWGGEGDEVRSECDSKARQETFMTGRHLVDVPRVEDGGDTCR